MARFSMHWNARMHARTWRVSVSKPNLFLELWGKFKLWTFHFSTLHLICYAHDVRLYSCGVIDCFGWKLRVRVGGRIHCESEWALQWKRRDMDFDPREHEPCLSPAAFVNQVQYSNILEGRFKQLQGKTVCSRLIPHILSPFSFSDASVKRVA